MKLRRYNSYKDSGIFWFGEIPRDWTVKRIKDLALTKSGTTPNSSNKSYYESGVHNWIRTTDLNNGELYDVEYKITDTALEECRLNFLPINTVLIAMYGGFGTIGKNAILKKESTINQSVCAILPKKSFDSKYLLYFMKYFRHDWRLFADGTRKDPNINQDAVKNLFLIIPPKKEQAQIANYLDQKTAAIDKKIELLEEKVKKYQELRKSLINETVCRGLAKNVKLKDSGIKWIGDIPENWDVHRMKDRFKITKSQVGEKSSDYKLLSLTKNGIIYRDVEKAHGKYPAEFNTYQKVKSGDLVFCLFDMDVTPRTIGYSDLDGMITGAYTVVQSSEDTFSKYFYYLYLMIDSSKNLSRYYSGLRNTIKKEVFMGIPIPHPSLNEQKNIANYLDQKTAIIDNILKNIKKQLNELMDLRKSIINDVVTGQIKVTEE